MPVFTNNTLVGLGEVHVPEQVSAVLSELEQTVCTPRSTEFIAEDEQHLADIFNEVGGDDQVYPWMRLEDGSLVLSPIYFSATGNTASYIIKDNQVIRLTTNTRDAFNAVKEKGEDAETYRARAVAEKASSSQALLMMVYGLTRGTKLDFSQLTENAPIRAYRKKFKATEVASGVMDKYLYEILSTYAQRSVTARQPLQTR